MISVNESIGIPNARASEISKEYGRRMKGPYTRGELSDGGSLRIIQEMDLSPTERTWLAYHVGGINRALRIAKEGCKSVVINW